MIDTLHRPVLLDKTHRLDAFDCGRQPLNNFRIKHALQNQAGGGARMYVMLRGDRVIGYYSLAPASVAPEDVPLRVMKGQGQYPVPVILTARFAIDITEQGKGLGADLLNNAFRRGLEGSEAIGGRAFMVHAKDESAKSFYLRFGMEPSPTNPLHLFLLFKDIRQGIARLR